MAMTGFSDLSSPSSCASASSLSLERMDTSPGSSATSLSSHIEPATSKSAATGRYARSILNREAAALLAAADRLEQQDHFETFQQALQEMTNLQSSGGKLIISGIGKSALIGSKAAATFNSLGTSALFLDPVAALHGDLGIISPNGKDIAILISYSGSTSELLHLAPILRSRCASVISLSGNKDSQLARTADIAIDAAIGGDGLEADTDVPAPSSSLAVSMGLLDALALSALRENVDGSRSKAQSAFLSNHPGGHLGRQLTTALSTF